MKTSKTIVGLFASVCVALLTGIDQLTKKLIVLNIPRTGDISIIDNVFKIVYVKNTGAAWGILKDGTIFLSILSLIAIACFIFLFFRLDWSVKRHRPVMVLSVFIVAGALGNLIDRVFLHYVIDFLYFELINFPVFNVADCYITVSMFVLAFLMIFYYKEEDFGRIWKKRS